MLKTDNFNPNDLGIDNGNLFGLPIEYNTSEVVVLPVCWDATVSYNEGTSEAPDWIQKASLQVDLYDLDYKNFWKNGVFYDIVLEALKSQNTHTRSKVNELIDLLSQGKGIDDEKVENLSKKIDEECEKMISLVRGATKKHLANNKKVILLGGDHSTPLGYIQSLSDRGEFGILQIDAHCDLRDSYEYMKYSHASIMQNALQLDNVKSLTQVGIRDFCEEEMEYIEQSEKPINVFFDRRLKERRFGGENWENITDEIVNSLPENVYLSFDIDGLNPSYCPNTGTPVMGGLEVEEALYLIERVKKSGRKYVGMDLNEVGNAEWDANVGARILYRMIGVIMNKENQKVL